MSNSINSSVFLQAKISSLVAAPEDLPAAETASLAGASQKSADLNPQPLPPKASILDSLRSHFDAVALNPQPLPPRQSILGALRSRFDAVALNPQPLPPFEIGASLRWNRLDAVALNPQPLPPKAHARETVDLWSLLRRFDAITLNPQPLPPKEPEPLANLNAAARALGGRS